MIRVKIRGGADLRCSIGKSCKRGKRMDKEELIVEIKDFLKSIDAKEAIIWFKSFK